MASFVVMGSPRDASEEELSFVRDGFSWLAFLFPPLWLIWHRLWVEAVVAVAVLMAAAALGSVEGLSVAGPLLTLLVSIFVGLEGNAMRVAARERRGWDVEAVIDADDEEDAGTRYAAATENGEDEAGDRPRIVPSASPPGAVRDGAVGLLLNPGR
jgi:hypothetical protein